MKLLEKKNSDIKESLTEMPNSKISLVNNFFLLFWVHSAATMCRRLKQIELKELKLSFTYVLFFFLLWVLCADDGAPSKPFVWGREWAFALFF